MNDSELDHLLELAHGYIEGSLGSAQLGELEALLMANPGARRIYLDFLHDHAVLHWDRVADGGAMEGPELTSIVPPPRRRLPWRWTGAAAAALMSLLAYLALRSGTAPDTFARMKETESAQWESGSLPTVQGSRLGAGELELVRGLATIAFDSGAEVVLEAPAKLTLVDGMNCVLARGTAVAEVGESAKGFTIRTPSARVIDHGTRFAVNVDPGNGATQTQVFDGLVEVEQAETKERVALREGQQNLVAGASLGGISEGDEEGTWAKPDAPLSVREPGLTKLTTAAPGGADAYVWGGRPTSHNSETLLLLKNGIQEDAPHRKAYLRFSLDSIKPGSIGSARLELHFTPTGWGLASHLGDSEFSVYGLIDDAMDSWQPAGLAWENAPANEPGSGHRLDSTKVRELGRFSVPRGIQSGSFGIGSEALREFLNSDANRSATLIVVRETPETRGGGLVHGIASSRHPTLPAPSLLLRVAD
jgi:hypothetical protein